MSQMTSLIFVTDQQNLPFVSLTNKGGCEDQKNDAIQNSGRSSNAQDKESKDQQSNAELKGIKDKLNSYFSFQER